MPWAENPFGFYLAIVDQWNLDVVSADETMGSTEGSGRFPDESYDTIRAIPLPGYRFAHWNDGSTENLRVICLRQDTLFTAYFTTGERYILQVDVNNDEWGSVDGAGGYPENTVVTLTATPAQYCGFELWSDGDWHNPRTLTLTQDTVLTANFFFDSSLLASIHTAEILTFTLSPNPTGSLLYITTANDDSYTAEIFDDRGRKVAGCIFHTPKFEIDVSSLPDGHYTLRLSSGKNVGTKAFVKQR